MMQPAGSLVLDDVHAFYGKSHVLHGVNLRVDGGEIVSLLGRNGAGRSTVAKAVMGMMQARGSVRWNGRELLGLRPFQVARLGLGYVPESRDIFPGLSVRQNLLLGRRRGAAAAWSEDEVFGLFPVLRERADTAAGVLSGGEQQMLALCRSLMAGPRCVLVDEPTEGLAPRVVEQVAQFLLGLRARGVAVLLIEQKLTIALHVAQRCCVMGHGRVVFEGTPDELRANAYVRKEWLAV